jgi:methylase of polypeptide subunit release factors
MQRFVAPDEELFAATSGGRDARLSALVALLALGRPVRGAEARNALAPVALEDLGAAGLLAIEGDDVIANYCLLPHDGLLLAGDVPGYADREIVQAWTNPSLTLARTTPRTPRRSMLDLGTGSGVAALRGAAHCDHVTGVDINPRALMLAGFNARLNDTANVELLEGSWFEPVPARRFDLIVSNPPYVVSPDHEFTYRDSGAQGGALLETLCRETAAHLEADGIGILLASWPHASGNDWAAAPTAWVDGTGCDALILRRETVDALDHAVNWNTPPVRFLDPRSLREAVARWVGHYREIGAGMISFGTVVLRRRSSGDPWLSALDAPAPVGEHGSEQLVRILRGQDLSRSADDRALMATRFSLPAGVDVSQRFQRRDTGFVARPAMVSLAGGLGVRAAIDPDALDAVFACDGTRTLGEIVDGLATRRRLPVDPLADIVAGATRRMLAHGLLDGLPVDGLRVDGLPAPREGRAALGH